MSGIELAPAGLARIAGAPLSRLAGLADPGLAASLPDDPGPAPVPPGWERTFREGVAAERERLAALTLDDDRFRLALAFTAPAVAALLAGRPRGALAARRRRRLDATLYRYLARWTARAEPLGLWAGVARVGWGDESRIVPGAETIRLAPDLRPFFLLFAALAGRPEYLRRTPWEINPTLGPDPEGGWSFWAPTWGGAVRRRLRAPEGVIETLAAASPAPAPELAAALRARGLGEEVAQATVRISIEGGALVGGLQPPWRFASPAEALLRAEEELVASDRAAWREARERVGELCARLGGQPEVLTAEGILAAHGEVAARLGALAAALDLPPPALPDCLLRCDWRLGCEVELGPEARARIARTAADYLAFQGRFGLGEALRRGVLGHYLPPESGERGLAGLPPPAVAGEPGLTWEGLAEGLGGGELGERLARWRELLGRGGERVVAEGGGRLPGPPIGWLRLGFDRWPPEAAESVVHGVFDDLWGPYARHAFHWEDPGGEDSLLAWLRRRLGESAVAAGIEVAELVAPCPQLPNALARPPLARPVVAPWSALPGALSLRGARVVRAPGGGVLLRLAGEARKVAVVNTVSADLQSGDPLVQLLLATSGGATPATGMQAASVPFAHELEEGERTSPAVVLAGGEVVRTRRTALGREAVTRLAAGGEAERFAAWVRLARRHRLPALLLARRADGLSLLVARDSPLAVAALLHGAAPAALTLEDWPGQEGLEVEGRLRVGELAIPFARPGPFAPGGGEGRAAAPAGGEGG